MRRAEGTALAKNFWPESQPTIPAHAISGSVPRAGNLALAHFFFCTMATWALMPHAHAQELKPLWEAGLGVGAIAFPAYRGSNQTETYLLPVPYFVYRGRWLKADRNGLRGVLWNTARAELTLSAALSPPAPSSRVSARDGMPDLKATFEVGPQLNFTLWTSPREHYTLKLELPLRSAHTLELHPRNIGWVFNPKLNLDLHHLPALAGWDLGLQAGALFGDRRQNQYFYGVAPEYAQAGRPAYDAPAGFAGTQYLAALSRRQGNLWMGAFIRYDNLAGARFADSPLIHARSDWAAGIAVTWVLGSSSTLVSSRD